MTTLVAHQVAQPRGAGVAHQVGGLGGGELALYFNQGHLLAIAPRSVGKQGDIERNFKALAHQGAGLGLGQQCVNHPQALIALLDPWGALAHRSPLLLSVVVTNRWASISAISSWSTPLSCSWWCRQTSRA